jgi:hypothetical protein
MKERTDMRNGALVGLAVGVWLGLAFAIGFTSMLLVVGLGIAGAIVGVTLTGIAFGAGDAGRRPAGSRGRAGPAAEAVDNPTPVGWPTELRGVRH